MQKVPIKLIENHDEAYYFWKKLKVAKKPLIHLDAHIDFNFHPAKPLKQTLQEAKSKDDLIRQMSANLMYKQMRVKESALTNIGNYIYPAMRDGIVSDFYWVIPGDRKEFKRSRKNLFNIMRSFFSRDPFEKREITKNRGMLKARIYERNFIFTTLEDLPGNLDGALLDIDTDYLTTGTIREAGAEQAIGKRFPWIWPEGLVKRLKEKKITPSCITIAYSVNGGFTPLIYKFLADEVGFFFNSESNTLKDAVFLKNRALQFFKNGKIKNAIGIFENILRDLDTTPAQIHIKNKLKAHIAFMLFRCYAKLKAKRSTKFYYVLSVQNDKTYRAKDNNYGPLYLRVNRGLRKAGEEFRLVLSTDKDNTYAVSGLASVFLRSKKVKKAKAAKALFKKSYTLDRKNHAALFGLCQSELLLKNYKAVLKNLKSLKKKALFSNVYALSAQAYAGLGRFEEALNEYSLAFRFGMDLNLCLKLFKLMRKTGTPEKHKAWIASRIDAYENYRRDFLKTKTRPAGKLDLRMRNRTKNLIKQIDKLLKGIKQAQ